MEPTKLKNGAIIINSILQCNVDEIFGSGNSKYQIEISYIKFKAKGNNVGSVISEKPPLLGATFFVEFISFLA